MISIVRPYSSIPLEDLSTSERSRNSRPVPGFSSVGTIRDEGCGNDPELENQRCEDLPRNSEIAQALQPIRKMHGVRKGHVSIEPLWRGATAPHVRTGDRQKHLFKDQRSTRDFSKPETSRASEGTSPGRNSIGRHIAIVTAEIEELTLVRPLTTGYRLLFLAPVFL